MRQYQNVTTNQQQIIEPTILERPLANHKQEDEDEDGEEEGVVGE